MKTGKREANRTPPHIQHTARPSGAGVTSKSPPRAGDEKSGECRTRCGTISVVGKPNVGKSSLLNALVGTKITSVSPKPGTTRHRVYGVVTRGRCQAIFVDTPGLFQTKTALDEFMERRVLRAVEGVDAIVMMVDPRGAQSEDMRMIQRIKSKGGGAPTVLVVNKIDLLKDPAQAESCFRDWDGAYPWAARLAISVKEGLHLDALWRTLAGLLPLREFEVAPDAPPVHDTRLLIADLVREKALHLTREEVPHCIACLISLCEDKPRILRIEGDLIVERESQKKILIGDGGQMIKKIGTAAREELAALFKKSVYLGLRVKVHEGWRQNPSRLAMYGYKD